MIQIVTSGLIAVGVGDMLANRAGPGGVSLVVREWLSDSARPAWMQAGAQCVYCFGFYGALLGAALCKPRSVRGLLRTWLAGFGLAVAFFLYVEQ